VHARVGHALRELRILGQEPVARMHAVDTRTLEDVEQQILVQIAVARRRRADRVSLGRHFEVRRAVIRFRIDRDRLDAHFVQRTQHTRGNGAAVCYDHFVEHRNLSTAVGAAMATGKS